MDSESEKKVDTELVKVIEDVMSNSKSNIEALDKVLKFKKKCRGLIGMRISASDELLHTKDKDEQTKMEELAHAILIIERMRALGEIKMCKEVLF